MGLLLACKAINKYGTKSGMNKTKKPFNHLNKRFLKFIKVTPMIQNPNHLMEDLKLLSEVFAA